MNYVLHNNNSLHVDYFQIGSHIGDTENDLLYKKITVGKNIVLIEPIISHFNQLKVNYVEKSKKNNIIFLNIAISDFDGIIPIYTPSPLNNFVNLPKWTTQISSVVQTHIFNHRSTIIADKIHVYCKTINTVVKEYDIKSIEYLICDTEGHDYAILKKLDLGLIRPKNIIFESCHMDNFLEKSVKYGDLIEHFKKNGYVMYDEDEEDTHLRLKD